MKYTVVIRNDEDRTDPCTVMTMERLRLTKRDIDLIKDELLYHIMYVSNHPGHASYTAHIYPNVDYSDYDILNEYDGVYQITTTSWTEMGCRMYVNYSINGVHVRTMTTPE